MNIKMLKLTGNILIVFGLIYFFVFGLESKSPNVIMHGLIGGALMIIGLVLTIFNFIKSRK